MEPASSLRQAGAQLLKKLDEWGVLTVKMLPNLIVAVMVLIIITQLSRPLARLVGRAVFKVSRYRHIARLMATLTRLAVILFGIILALDVLDLDRAVASLLAGAGIIGFAVGFASQDIAANFIAGILLHFIHPFRLGDLIKSGDFLGYVETVDMRSTKVRNQQGQRITIPNKILLANPIINYTITGVRRVDITVAVDWAEDLPRVEELIVKAVEALEEPLRNPERPVDFYYEKFDGTNMNFSLRFWTQPDQPTYLRAASEALKAISRTLKENGIGMASSTIALDFGMPGGHGLRKQLEGMALSLSPPEAKPAVMAKD
jgi:small conductance mechanosensitive channel